MLSLHGEGGGIFGAGAAQVVLLAGEQDEQALAAARLPVGPPPRARRALPGPAPVEVTGFTVEPY
ncbi:hypothetical protein ACH4OT_09105 [Streptomyces murinus]|uniref:hypothetical protein n=1 Tax=Streptomyces murinus TaxID=33900 RepID=UPI00379A1624